VGWGAAGPRSPQTINSHLSYNVLGTMGTRNGVEEWETTVRKTWNFSSWFHRYSERVPNNLGTKVANDFNGRRNDVTFTHIQLAIKKNLQSPWVTHASECPEPDDSSPFLHYRKDLNPTPPLRPRTDATSALLWPLPTHRVLERGLRDSVSGQCGASMCGIRRRQICD
jgi:hypothetical protein